MKATIVSLFLVFVYANQLHAYSFETKYIDVPLDHFSFAKNFTFKLRYFVNDTFYKESGPIFFYTGNEGDINMFAQNTGFMFDIAPEFNALIVFAEHRYYGESLPFGNLSYTSPEYLGYLSSTQALADFVVLIDYLKETYTLLSQIAPPVVAFGGSYGGMLSTWLRLKYPYSIVGTIASSAPIWQFPYLTECDSFSRTATATFRKLGGEKCPAAIIKAWDVITNVTSTSSGRNYLSDMWKICDPLQPETVIGLKQWLEGIYYNLAEMNYPYETNFIMPLPANPVVKFCSRIKENIQDDYEFLRNFGEAIQVYANHTGTTECINLYQTASDDLGELGWSFQACTEMIQYLCSTDRDMFQNYDFDYKAYSEGCFATFGVRPRSINVPIQLYGGKDLATASNIVFSNGVLDPWSGLGVLQDISSTVISVIIPNGAHHLDLRARNKDDPVDVIEARQIEINEIKRWITEYYQKNI